MLTRIDHAGVTVRLAGPDDDEVTDVLAELDSAPPLTGRRLLALADGWPVAAISLEDGRVVANPFAPTAQAVALLRLRATQLEPSRPPRAGWVRTWWRPHAV